MIQLFIGLPFYHCTLFMSYMVGYVDDVILWYYRCVVAYASDLLYSGVSLNPHRERGLKTYSLSLDHSYVSTIHTHY
jgi:hypothetical protein